MASANKPVDYSRKRVLLVESSSTLRSAISQMLRTLGVHNLQATGNYREIGARLEYERFDFILIAHNESDKVSGLQVLEEARLKRWTGPGTDWILLTGNASQETVLHAIDNEPDAMLSKPFSVADLKKRMDALWLRQEAFKAVTQAADNGDIIEAAKLCLTRFSIHSPYREEAELRACEYFLDMGEYAQVKQIAERLYWRAERKEPGLLLARALLHLGQLDEAFELLQKLIQKNPLYLAPYDLLAMIFDLKGDVSSALEVMKSATKKSPMAVLRQRELGRLATSISELDVAEFAYKRSIVHGQHSCHHSYEPFLSLANVVRLKGVTDDALGRQRQKIIGDILAAANRAFVNDKQLKVKTAMFSSELQRDIGRDEESKRLANEAAELNALLDEPVNFAELMSGLNGARPQSPFTPSVANNPAANPKTTPASITLKPGTKPKLSKEAQEKSRQANRQGVKLYASHERLHALKFFKMAVKQDPNYFAALLNLAQLYLELARDEEKGRQQYLDHLANAMDKMATLPSSEDQKRKYDALADLWEGGLEALPSGPVGQMLR
ncbi:MAG: response regulator [Pontibacterium sp.]